MANLKEEIQKLGYKIRLINEGEITCVVTIPKYDIEETTTIWEDENNYHIATADQPGWDEYFPKQDWTLQESLEDFYKPMEDE